MTTDAMGSGLSPAVLFREPPTLGWEFRQPTSQPFEQGMADQVRRRELEAELLQIEGSQGRIAELRRRLSGPRVNQNVFFGALAVLLLSVLLGLNGFAGFMFLCSLGALIYAWPYHALRAERREVDAYDAKRAAVARDLERLHKDLELRQAQHERTETERVARSSLWYPVVAPGDGRRLEIFGGNKIGWEAFLLTFGASLLGSSRRLLVLDLTERHIATHLARLALETRRTVQYLALPEQAAAVDLFAGLSAREMVECVVNAWHDAESESQARKDATQDAFVLGRVCDCLDEGAVTVPRLSAAVMTLLRMEDPEEGTDELLTQREQVRLERAFGEQLRSAMHFTDRLLGLAGFLRQLHRAAPQAASDAPTADLSRLDSDLTLVELTAEGDLLDKRALAAVTVQVLQKHHARRRRANAELPSHILVVGADSIGPSALQRLSRFAADSGVQVTYFFESLQSPGADIIGSGDAVQLFMRLGVRKDAERAADHVGRQRKFVLSQLSTSESDSVSETYGEQVGQSRGRSVGLMSLNIGRVPLLIPSVTGNSGSHSSTSWGKQTGKSRQQSETQNLVYEHVVDPEQLMRLGQYVFLLQTGPDRVVAGDCDPELAYSPQLAPKPLSIGSVAVSASRSPALESGQHRM